MRENQRKLAQRGELLDNMNTKAQGVQDAAQTFAEQARQLKEKMQS